MTSLTVCVPVYNAAAFVEPTLAHIAAQTHRDFHVLVSVDRGDDESEPLCRRFESDRRFQVFVQPERLGWVGNVNALITRVSTPLFCITPHDDLLEPRYLEAMVDVLAREPDAACVYSDITGFGAHESVNRQQDVRGDRLHRVLDVLLNHYDGVAFRGVVRRRDTHDRPYLPVGIPRDFAADTAWMTRLALRGELRRVPEPLYRKWYGAASVHAEWTRFPRPELVVLYASMVAMSTRLALEEIHDAAEREEVLTAGLLRAAGLTRGGGVGVPATDLEIATAVAHFAQATADLGAASDPYAVMARTGMTVLREAIAQRHPTAADPTLSQRIARRVRRLLNW